MRLFFEHYGCTMNAGESRELQRTAGSLGHEVVDAIEEADVAVLSTCIVIGSTERRMYRRIREIVSMDKGLIVSGCMPVLQEDQILAIDPDIKVVMPGDAARFAEIVGESQGPSTVSETPSGNVEGIVPIAQGCLGECSYCITRLARGALRSYGAGDITGSVKTRLREGCREIRVTAQDTAAYGRDIGTDLPSLIDGICAVEGDFRVRVGMMNPDTLRSILGPMKGVYQNEKVYSFLHLPVQSGSDRVLEAMSRRYTVQEFKDIVRDFRDSVPGLMLSTDIIVGFPGEEEADFEASMELVRDVRPDIVNVTRFSPRPGTRASEMSSRIHSREVKERSRRLAELRFQVSREGNEGCVGQELQVLTTEGGKEGTTIARTDSYRPVVIEGEMALGQFIRVRITGARDVYLVCELL